MRGLRAAIGLLTRLPLPGSGTRAVDFAHAVRWFPWVGLMLGGLLAWVAGMFAGQPWLCAWALVLAWVGLTGGLHLDGVADLADGFACAHGDPARLHAAMKEPHVGAFGVMAIVLVLLSKFAAIASVALAPPLAGLLLVPAWMRYAALLWAALLPPLAGSGLGRALADAVRRDTLLAWGLALSLLGVWLVSWSFVVVAWAFVWGWQALLRRRLGGMNGDALGAGIEYGECALLLALAIGH